MLPNADPRRVYVVGHDIGGRGALYMAYRHPERITAVIAASADAPLDAWATRLSHTPIWYLHGVKDEFVPVREADSLVQSLRDAGSDVKYTRLDHWDHSLITLFEDPNTYRWLLQFSKPGVGRNLL
jgi:predicted peptidase